ncbi:hypothetical protein GBAR_LOCUS8678 [Geodia barretti]|uniref:Uncharacterized protein n=1 Tax=Geodia barretti TaxID=519541 RepID=A0AA35RLI3_GEOBA|nr:hypothetical protein GBAR_LOCUS8678 [Geodia barretti]
MQDNEAPKRERLIRGVGQTVTDAVVRGTDEAVTAAENLKETIKSKTSGDRQARDNVVMVRVDKDSLGKMDELVEAEVAGSRSEAAAYLITEGIKVREPLFKAISAKVEEIRKAKEELRNLLKQEQGGE